MSHQNDIESHPAWTVRDAIQQTLDGQPWPDAPDARATLERVKWVLVDVQARREATTVHGLAVNSLDSLNAGFNQLHANLNQLFSAPTQYWPAVEQACDTVVSSIGSWAPARGLRAVQSATEAGLAFRVAAEEAIENLRTTISDIRQQEEARTKQLEQAASDQQIRADEAMSTLQTEVDRLTQTAMDQSTRVDALLNGLSQTFQQSEAQRAQEARDAAEKARKASQAQQDDTAQQAAGLLDELRQQREQAQNILRQMGVEATTSEYSAYAKQERRAGHVWNFIALLLAGGGAAALAWALHTVSDDAQMSWQLLTLKSALGIVLVVIAGWAGKQGAGHRRQERRAKSYALALNVLDPFLANVEPETAKKLRAIMVAKLIEGHDEPADEDGTMGLGALLRSLRERSSSPA